MKRDILFENDEELLKQGYTKEQIKEIQIGVAQNLDISVYLNKQYMSVQMRQIRLGLQEDLPVHLYANLDYDCFQMEEIRKGFEAKGIEIPFNQLEVTVKNN